MYNIILVCEHGASTGMMTDRIKDAAAAQGIDVIVNAFPYTKLQEIIDAADIVLLGPQVRFKKKIFEQQYADQGVKFMVIDTVDYGMMNGEKVLKAALECLKTE